jgi:hypothetical protein
MRMSCGRSDAERSQPEDIPKMSRVDFQPTPKAIYYNRLDSWTVNHTLMAPLLSLTGLSCPKTEASECDDFLDPEPVSPVCVFLGSARKSRTQRGQISIGFRRGIIL